MGSVHNECVSKRYNSLCYIIESKSSLPHLNVYAAQKTVKMPKYFMAFILWLIFAWWFVNAVEWSFYDDFHGKSEEFVHSYGWNQRTHKNYNEALSLDRKMV